MNQKTKFSSDIDIDFGDRTQAINVLDVIPASIRRDDHWVAHNTGVYVTDMPKDPFTGRAGLDYKDAEDRGYAKLDFLNVSLYTQIKSEAHLADLMKREVLWDLLYDAEFCAQLIHVGNHHSTLLQMPEPVNSIPRLAMFLSVIRPAKRHLIGKTWKEVAETVWVPDPNGVYGYKKAHAISYAHLVVVHMNLLCEQISQDCI
jgi:hypothetical protein